MMLSFRATFYEALQVSRERGVMLEHQALRVDPGHLVDRVCLAHLDFLA